MIYERLVLMRDLLAEDGSIYVHCDWRVNSFMRLVMEEVFSGFKHTEIIWICGLMGSGKVFPKAHESILLYRKDNSIFNMPPGLAYPRGSPMHFRKITKVGFIPEGKRVVVEIIGSSPIFQEKLQSQKNKPLRKQIGIDPNQLGMCGLAKKNSQENLMTIQLVLMPTQHRKR
jgi:hypothetical protein